MSIALLSIDAWSLICLSADGRDVLCLALCGNALLTSKIVASLRGVRFRARPFTAFPFSAYALPYLAQLSVRLEKEYSFLPLRLNHRLPLPSEPIPALTKLCLSFSQSFAVLRLESDTPLLSRLFPQLQHLELSSSSEYLQERHLLALPQTLLSLKLETAECSESQLQFASIPYLALEKLPQHLESLTIGVMNLLPDPRDGFYDALTFPSTLRHLSLYYVFNARILRRLPPLLEYLDLQIMETTSSETIRASDLPASLTHCVVESECYGFLAIKPDGPFPPGLVTFNSPLELGAVKNLENLPSSVTELNYQINTLLSNIDVLQHFSHLKSLSYYRSGPKEFLNQPLPRFLVQLSLNSTSPSFIPWKSLPTTLQQVSIQVETTEQMEAIPRGVTDLVIPMQAFNALSKETFEALPQKLTRFSFFLQHLTDVDCVDVFPSSITMLSINSAREHPSIVAQDTTLPDHLAHMNNMVKLQIQNYSSSLCWREWVVQCGNVLPKLENLLIQGSYMKDEGMKSDAYLKQLPQNLRVFVTNVFSRLDQDPDILAHLPPNLRILEFVASFHASEVYLNDKQLSRLPPSLTTINLSPFHGLTDRALSYLPPSLDILQRSSSCVS